MIVGRVRSDDTCRNIDAECAGATVSQAASVLVLLIGVLLFLSPVVLWAAAIAPAWWWPFAAWAALVGLIALTMIGRRDS